MRLLVLLLVLPGTVALADPTGPARPAQPRITPAQAAMAKYRGDYGAPVAAKPCDRATQGEVVVCGQSGRGGSPDRLPLPDERGARGVRIATGEAPHLGVGDSPVRNPKGTGLTLTLKAGGTTLKGNGQ
jgi:hypothetical protein